MTISSEKYARDCFINKDANTLQKKMQQGNHFRISTVLVWVRSGIQFMTRKHSSRIHTVHLLTISHSIPCVQRGEGWLPTSWTYPHIHPWGMSTHPSPGYPPHSWIPSPQKGPGTRDTHHPLKGTWYQRYPRKGHGTRNTHPMWVDTHLWKHYLTSFEGDKDCNYGKCISRQPRAMSFLHFMRM